MASVQPVVDSFCKDEEIAGIGIGAPGPLDIDKGTLLNQYTLNHGLYGMNIVELFRRIYKIPVRLDHDVNTALWAHHCFSGADEKDILMLTFGTGIGGAVLKNGIFLRGEGGSAPELGHILINERETSCYCGMSGCFESMASGQRFNEEACSAFETIPGFYKAYEEREPEALEIVSDFVLHIERGLISLIRSFEPERVILGGGMMEGFYPLFIDNMSEDFYSKAFVKRKFQIQQSSFGNNAGFIGAAGLILKGDARG
jgi:glucokinase